MLRPMLLVFLAAVAAGAQEEPPEVSTRRMAEALPDSTTSVVVINPRPGTLEALKRLTSLRELSTSGLAIGDEEVAVIAGFLTLKKLTLHECPQLTDVGVSALVALKELESLDLSMCLGLTDGALRPLESLKGLRELSVHGCAGMTGAGVEKLTTLQGLKIGYVERFDDRVLASLASLKSLERLNVDFSSITGTGFKALAGLKTLVEVSADDVDTLTPEGIRCLAALPNLIELTLTSEKMGDEAAFALSGAKELETLYVYGTQLTTKGIEALAALPKIDTISVTSLRVGYSGTRALTKNRRLRWIDARDAGLGDKSLRELASLPLLEALFVEDNPRVTNAGIKALAGCRTLKELSIGKSANLSDLSPLVALPELVSLSVAWSVNVTDDVIAPLVDAPKLRVLDISSTSVTGAGLISLVALKPLRDLDVNFCPEITEKAHEFFRKARPDVHLRTTR